MPVYQYECKTCAEQLELVLSAFDYEATRNIPRVCSNAHAMGRVYSFSFGRMESTFDTHKSAATGEVVTSKRQFSEQLKAKSAEMSERLGTSIDYQPVAPMDLAHTVKADGVASSYPERKRRTDLLSRWETHGK